MSDQIFDIYYCGGTDQFVVITPACAYLGPLSGLPEIFKGIEQELGIFYIDFPSRVYHQNHSYDPVPFQLMPDIRDAYARRNEEFD